MGQPIRVISSMATRQLLSSLASQFQQASGHAVEIESVGAVSYTHLTLPTTPYV